MANREFLQKIDQFTSEDFCAESINCLQSLKNESKTDVKCRMELFTMYLQEKLVSALQSYEPTRCFCIDRWLKDDTGGGISCVLQDGDVFEKAGVNISILSADLQENHRKIFESRGSMVKSDQTKFSARGVSCIIHPKNPFVPSMHFNFRYFETSNNEDEIGHFWFGGGIDMTPTYLDQQDAEHFHQTIKTACDKHDKDYYPRYKKLCDDSLFLEICDEYRGIGGFMFNELKDGNLEDLFDFVVTCGHAVLPSYIPIVNKHLNDPYDEENIFWQRQRRGRYVLFNLLYDRGTRFGLLTPGIRVENVLISMPLNAAWDIRYVPTPGSKEDDMLQFLKRKPKDWA